MLNRRYTISALRSFFFVFFLPLPHASSRLWYIYTMEIHEIKTTVLSNDAVNPLNEDIIEVIDNAWSISLGLNRHPDENKISFNSTFTLKTDFSNSFFYVFSVENITYYNNNTISPEIKILLNRVKENFNSTFELLNQDLEDKGFDITNSNTFPFSDEEILKFISDLIALRFSDLN